MDDFVVVNEHALLAKLLRPGIAVVDLGAHRGGFGATLAADYPGTYHAVEANPDLAAALEASGIYASVRNCAATDRTGPITLRIAENAEASSVLVLPAESVYDAVEVGTVEVDGVALSDLLNSVVSAGPIDVLKVDIEGAEIGALSTLTRADLRRVGQISVEFHSAREFGFGLVAKTFRTMWRLRLGGFVTLDFGPHHRNVLFVNRGLVSHSPWTRATWHLEAATIRWRLTFIADRVAFGRWRRQRGVLRLRRSPRQ